MKEVLRKAGLEDAQFLLDCHNASRLGFLNPKIVELDEHIVWLTKQICQPHIYVCEVGGQPVGSVRACKIDGGWELHWEIIPTYRGKGYATRFAKKLVSLLSGKLVAEIKPNNLASIKVAKALGLKQTSNLKWER